MRVQAELYAFIRQGQDVLWHGPVGGTYDAFHPAWTATGRKLADAVAKARPNINGHTEVIIEMQGRMVMTWTD